jgi:predicted unusual protein kinase regulating ubiquinone biosynthesis (AarF/ABC1/UbiB family)
MRRGLYAVLQRDPDKFLARMDAMGMISPGAHADVRRAVETMFERIASRGGGRGALGVAGGQVLALKDEAVSLLRETPGLQLPNDLLLYAKTLSYLFALGERLDPEVDLVQITLPYLLRFLAGQDETGADRG